MRYRVLGPVEVVRGDTVVPIVRRRERCLLGLLLLQAGRIVPVDRLVDLLWDGEPAEHARRTVQSHVARIRATVSFGPGEELLPGGGGYLLRVDPDTVDAHRFRSLVADARQTTDLVKRMALLEQAVDLWRGELLQDAATDRLRDRLGDELDALRLDAVEERLAAGVEMGQHQELLPELARVTALHPAREAFAELYMRALHRVGRDADALEVYARMRAHLADELGLEPGPRLQKRQRAILRQEPDSSPTTPVAPARPPVPAGLPIATRAFVGRTAELTLLDDVIAQRGIAAPVVTIVGTGGIGKTALAVQWGHRVRASFPDGQLFVDMHGYSKGNAVKPIDALGRFLRALGTPAEQIPSDLDEAAATYRSRLADRRMLVIVDNVRTSDDARPLLPGGGDCVTLMTSRDRLDGLVAIDGADRLHLDLLAESESVELLSQLIGPAWVRADPTSASDLAKLCGRLPLALRITAARLAGTPDPRLGEHVSLMKGDRLRQLSIGEPAVSIESTLDYSYRRLPARAARLFRLLGGSPAADLAPDAIAAMTDQPMSEVDRDLETLRAAHLVVELASQRTTLHDLVREYAGRRALAEDTADDRRESAARLLDWYTVASIRANLCLVPSWPPPPWSPEFPPAQEPSLASYGDAIGWFDQESRTLADLTRFAAQAAPAVVWPLVASQVTNLSRVHDAITLIEQSVLGFQVAERLGNDRARAAHAAAAGNGYAMADRPAEARRWFSEAIVWSERTGDLRRLARIFANMGGDQIDESIQNKRKALDILRRIDDRVGVAQALAQLGYDLLQAKRWAECEATLREALSALRQLGIPRFACTAEGCLGVVLLETGRYDEAAEHIDSALATAYEIGEQNLIGLGHEARGNLRLKLGRIDQARADWIRARDVLADIGSPELPRVEALLAEHSE
jgi:DNA-binding SARP family transcriptional activator